MSWIILSIIIFNHFSFIHFENGKIFFPPSTVNWIDSEFLLLKFFHKKWVSFIYIDDFPLPRVLFCVTSSGESYPSVSGKSTKKNVSKFFTQSDKKRKKENFYRHDTFVVSSFASTLTLLTFNFVSNYFNELRVLMTAGTWKVSVN